MQVVKSIQWRFYIDGLVQDCSNSIANALELLQSCTKPSICCSCELFIQNISIGGLEPDCGNSSTLLIQLMT